jgi:hypothetical protein
MTSYSSRRIESLDSLALAKMSLPSMAPGAQEQDASLGQNDLGTPQTRLQQKPAQ